MPRGVYVYMALAVTDSLKDMSLDIVLMPARATYKIVLSALFSK